MKAVFLVFLLIVLAGAGCVKVNQKASQLPPPPAAGSETPSASEPEYTSHNLDEAMEAVDVLEDLGVN